MQLKRQPQADITACLLCVKVYNAQCHGTCTSWCMFALMAVVKLTHDRSPVTCNHNRHMYDDLVQVEGLQVAVDSKDAELITLRKTLQHKEAQV